MRTEGGYPVLPKGDREGSAEGVTFEQGLERVSKSFPSREGKRGLFP